MKLSLCIVFIVCCVIGCSKSQSSYGSKQPKHRGKRMPLPGPTPGPPNSPADSSLGGYQHRDHPRKPRSAGLSCKTFSARPQCRCKHGFVGSPPNCTIGPMLWEACYNGNPCGPDSDCDMDDDGSRQCSCKPGFYGCPPHCKSGHRRNKVCKDCGPNSECNTIDFDNTRCDCAAGFVGEPPYCTAGPTQLKCCDSYPCGPNSLC